MDFIRNLFRRNKSRTKDMPDLQVRAVDPLPRRTEDAGFNLADGEHFQVSDQRIRLAVESVLDNEALTQELDDAAARVLISWGTTWAESLARRSAGAQEPDLDEGTSRRLRDVRRMMRSISRWAASQADMDQAERLEAVREILLQAFQAQNTEMPFTDEQLKKISEELRALSGQPQTAVNQLRQLIEKNIPDPL